MGCHTSTANVTTTTINGTEMDMCGQNGSGQNKETLKIFNLFQGFCKADFEALHWFESRHLV